ncbi:MAG: hypothetical protein QW478_08890 [Candidatus Micrarchaeaceae archaeon]
MRTKKHIGFNRLANKVAREYRKKGYSAKTARKYGQETAGKIYWYKKRRHR